MKVRFLQSTELTQQELYRFIATEYFF